MIKDMEQAYQTKEEVDKVEFEPVEANKWVCNYDIGRLVMFYSDILDQLRVGPLLPIFKSIY